MTKENKLALVMGFALILFVGILVSDHFSVARSHAELQPPDDPLTDLAEERQTNLVNFFNPPQEPAAGRAVAILGPGEANEPTPRIDSGPSRQPILQMPDLQQQRTTPPASTPARGAPAGRSDASTPVHVVRSGESLSEICIRYYGGVSRVGELAKLNGLDDPDSLTIGTELKLPGAPRDTTSSAARPGASSAPAKKTRTYTVRAGDVLSRIASREGVNRWRDLYELNRDVIKDPDHLVPGTVLRLP
ncbi:MAG: LysM peptidoglycan-binding domain-containing protein [Planctomycetota bacterium]|jgi:nucleoid-associated protein YgaU